MCWIFFWRSITGGLDSSVGGWSGPPKGWQFLIWLFKRFRFDSFCHFWLKKPNKLVFGHLEMWISPIRIPMEVLEKLFLFDMQSKQALFGKYLVNYEFKKIFIRNSKTVITLICIKWIIVRMLEFECCMLQNYFFMESQISFWCLQIFRNCSLKEEQRNTKKNLVKTQKLRLITRE